MSAATLQRLSVGVVQRWVAAKDQFKGDHMSDDIYRTLAQQLDAIPNGFPATESGAELRFLEKLFTLEEALLGGVMSMTPASTEEIAALVSVDAREARRTLKGMVRKGLITARRAQGEGARGLHFALMPFFVGFYEAQLPRMDAEMAALFETYFQDSRGLDIPGPSVHRVIPVGEAVKQDVEIQPYEQAAALLEGAKSWAVRDCICRVQQKLVGKGCDAPLEVCLMFAPVEGIFGGSKTDRVIDKREALALLNEAAEAGLVHTVGNYRENQHYICNCCTCCCGVVRRLSEFEVPNAVARSAFRALVDADVCIACGACAERCQFDAISVADVAVVDAGRCIGCGQCTLVCPVDAANSRSAISLVRRPEDEVLGIPLDDVAWGAARDAANPRGSLKAMGG
jgi:Na+-translocating ferredoxin:NAD+ oxidoreductase subunit B